MMRLILLLSLCLTFSGCGLWRKGEPEQVPVSGTVTLDGKPLAQGLIYFKTIAQGTIDSAEIKDGTFHGKAELGDRRVEVSAYEKGTVRPVGGDPMIPMSSQTRGKSLIPSCYNIESVLTAQVTRDGPNEFTFALKSK
jgi:hypothetical protein